MPASMTSATTTSWSGASPDLVPACTDKALDPVCSPGLARKDHGPAFELKFQLTLEEAAQAEAWARAHLSPDPHGVGGGYRTTTVYCDTAGFDVFHRTPGFRRNKYRLRRYGDAASVHLERKTRKGDRVRKRRFEVAAHEVAHLAHDIASDDWAGAWFHQRLRYFELRPICRVAYDRTAFFGQAGGMPVRLTIDRNLVGAVNPGWEVSPLAQGLPLLAGGALMEMKFHVHVPALFHDLLPRLPQHKGRVSKYRQCVQMIGLAQPRPACAPTADDRRIVTG